LRNLNNKAGLSFLLKELTGGIMSREEIKECFEIAESLWKQPKLNEVQKVLIKKRDFFIKELTTILIAKKSLGFGTYTGSLSEQDCRIGLKALDVVLGFNVEPSLELALNHAADAMREVFKAPMGIGVVNRYDKTKEMTATEAKERTANKDFSEVIKALEEFRGMLIKDKKND
jgi:hypothetical protein